MASVGLLVSPQGAGAHVNEGSCWTGLLLLPPPPFSSSFPLIPPLFLPPSLPSVPLSDGGADKPTSPQGTKRTMWSQLLQLLSLQPPRTFLIPLFPTCSSFDFLFIMPNTDFSFPPVLSVSLLQHTFSFSLLCFLISLLCELFTTPAVCFLQRSPCFTRDCWKLFCWLS